MCYRCERYGYLGLGRTASKYRRKVIEKGSRAFYGWYYFYYVSHYSPERKRCYIPEGIAWEYNPVQQCYFACCDYHIPEKRSLSTSIQEAAKVIDRWREWLKQKVAEEQAAKIVKVQ